MKKMTKMEKTNTNSNVQNNTHCTVNNGTVNNIYLVGYGKEDMSKIDRKDILKGMRLGFNSTLEMIDTIHFNPKYPEYHNVYISSMKNKYAMMYDGSNWTLVMKDDLIDKMYDNKRNYIEENMDDFLDSLTRSQINALHRWLAVDDDHHYVKKIKNDIKLLLYNKRQFALELRNNDAIISEQPEEQIDVPKAVKVTKDHKDVLVEYDLSTDADQKDHLPDEVNEIPSRVVVKKNKKRPSAGRPGTKRKTIKVTRS
jgi:hypothetical protein